MTTREVYEASVGMPWLPPELWPDTHPVTNATKWWWQISDTSSCIIPDSLASSAMMRAMVEWFHQMTGEVGSAVWDAAVREHKLYYITAENLLLACQSLHEQQKPSAHKKGAGDAE